MPKTVDLIKISVTEVAELLSGTVEGAGHEWFLGLSKIDQGQPGTLSFLANPKYAEHLESTEADVILINQNQELPGSTNKTFIRVDDAYLAFCEVLNKYFNPALAEKGVHPTAVISEGSLIGEDVYIGAHAFIGKNVNIGNHTKIFPNTFIGDGVSIDAGCLVYSNVSIYYGCEVGQNTIIHSGTVIGSDGFGHAPKPDGTYTKIPQVGNVIIGNDVEIGANCTIDRATLGSTKIGDGVKLDNLIQVAHNVEIGKHTVIAAQTGISGSTILGDNCMIGGQVGFAGHLKIAKGTQVGAQSGLNKDVEEPDTKLFGSPVMPLKDAFRSLLLVQKLPDMRDQLKDLEKQVAMLRREIESNGN